MFEARDGGVVGVAGGASEGVLLHVEGLAVALDVGGEEVELVLALGGEGWLASSWSHKASIGGVSE